MHLLAYTSLFLTASAISLPLEARVDPCDEVAEVEMVEADGVTSDKTAGIGAEFESPFFLFSSLGCSLSDTNAAKRKVVAGHTGTNFMLTADTGHGSGELTAEYILDGTQIKVGSGDGAKAGAAAAKKLIDWAPWKGDGQQTVNIADSNCNPWTIKAPQKQTDPADVEWQPQVTAPMPLEGLYSLMKEQVEDPEEINVLDGFMVRTNFLTLVTPDFFQSNPNNIDKSKATDDILGFCSLVLSYAKAATQQLGAEQSPKLFTTFMPRTEFSTIFEQVKSKIPGDLFTLFDTLACYKRDEDTGSLVIDTDFCSGSLSRPSPKSKLSTLSYTNPQSRVSIKAWIQGIQSGTGNQQKDLLSLFDESLDGSIGGLKKDTEKMFNSQRSVPLFEFRDLNTIPTSSFEDFMTKVDSSIQDLHKKFASPP